MIPKNDLIFPESSTRYYSGFLHDKTGAGIQSAAIVAITLALIDAKTGATINSHTETDVNGANGGTETSSSGTLTAATNAGPIACTSATHGLSNGDRIFLASVLGNPAANGSWLITKIDANTFSLDDSMGNGSWTAGGTWTHSNFEFEFTPGDTVISGIVANGAIEEHIATFTVTYNTSREENHRFRHWVRQMPGVA